MVFGGDTHELLKNPHWHMHAKQQAPLWESLFGKVFSRIQPSKKLFKYGFRPSVSDTYSDGTQHVAERAPWEIPIWACSVRRADARVTPSACAWLHTSHQVQSDHIACSCSVPHSDTPHLPTTRVSPWQAEEATHQLEVRSWCSNSSLHMDAPRRAIIM